MSEQWQVKELTALLVLAVGLRNDVTPQERDAFGKTYDIHISWQGLNCSSITMFL